MTLVNALCVPQVYHSIGTVHLLSRYFACHLPIIRTNFSKAPIILHNSPHNYNGTFAYILQVLVIKPEVNGLRVDVG